MLYSSAKIRKYHLQFNAYRKYEDKVKFFDETFSIIPFEFPVFNVDLHSFFSDDNFYRLHEILDYERSGNPFLKSFHFDNEAFDFSIKPYRHNLIMLNKYIVYKFLGTSARYELLVHQSIHELEAKGVMTDLQLQKANDAIAMLQVKVKQDYRLNVKSQFITVFMNGLTDAATQAQPLLFYRKMKVIELYLYAMGFLFGKYMQEVKRRWQLGDQHASTHYAIEIPAAIKNKVVLLQELGCIEAICKKYSFLNKEERIDKLAEVLSSITGDNWFKFNWVIEYVLLAKI